MANKPYISSKQFKMTFDLTLSNALYKKNIASYLRIAGDSLKMIEDQNDEFIQHLANDVFGQGDWLEESSYLQNVNWLFLNSVYITLFSSFEHFLLKVSKTIEAIPGMKIQLKHMGGSAILDKYVNYIYLVGGIESANASKSPWDKVAQFKAVRNLLVHNGGIMQDTNHPELEKHKNFKFLKNHDVIMAGSFGLIRVRNLNILEAFSKITTKISDDILVEFQAKYAE